MKYPTEASAIGKSLRFKHGGKTEFAMLDRDIITMHDGDLFERLRAIN